MHPSSPQPRQPVHNHLLEDPGALQHTRVQQLLQIQSLAGNRAAQELVEAHHRRAPGRYALQRLPAEETRTAALQAELDAILATIPSPPKVPAFEAITSTTSSEYSRLEWEQAMQRSWQRQRLSFTQTARQVARTTAADRPVSTEGPRLRPQVPYAQRWTLNLIASNYQRGAALGHVANFLRQGSPFGRAQTSESDRVITVNDPTGEGMRSRIMDAVLELFAVLPEGQNGELVVYFSGHGSGGDLVGVDFGRLYPADLRSLANFARDWNVHLVYIVDSCRAGGLVESSQSAAIESAEGEIERLPAGQRAGLRTQASAARTLALLTGVVSTATLDAAEELRHIHAFTPANRMKMMRAFNKLSQKVENLRFLLTGGTLPAGLVANQEALLKAIGDLSMGILVAYGGGGRESNRVLRLAALVLDQANTAVNGLVESINQQISPSAPRPTE